jgi:hypothetical protein
MFKLNVFDPRIFALFFSFGQYVVLNAPFHYILVLHSNVSFVHAVVKRRDGLHIGSPCGTCSIELATARPSAICFVLSKAQSIRVHFSQNCLQSGLIATALLHD